MSERYVRLTVPPACLMLFALTLLFCPPGAHGQAMPLGTVSSVANPTCSSLQRGFDLAANGTTQCFTASIDGCLGADNLPFAYAVTPPNSGTALLGTIVLLTGGRRHLPHHERVLDVLLAVLPQHRLPGC